MRVAEPAKFPELVEELEKAQIENMEAMAELADVVREEAEKALHVAEERFKALEEKKLAAEAAAEEKKLAKEKADHEKQEKAKEVEERLGNIIIEATQEVEDAKTL